jgi:glutamate synthase domain-containing protein 2
MPMREGVNFAHNALVGLNIRDRIKIGASGKIATAFDIARAMALGADWCNSARGFMFALGCIQSLSCHTDRCPTGIATQDPKRWRRLDTADKSTRVFQFHENTVKALRDLLCAAGLEHPRQLGPEHILRRVSQTEVRSLAALYRFLDPGELLERMPEHAVFRSFWSAARSDSFVAPDRVLAMREAKNR